MELICDTPVGTTKLKPELANWLVMLWKLVVAESAAEVLVTTIDMCILSSKRVSNWCHSANFYGPQGR